MSDTANADMAAFWNGEGGAKWVRLETVLELGLQPFGGQALAVAAAQPGEQVLDIGCGCGSNTLMLAAQVGSRGGVTGVDISQTVLDQARANAATGELTNVTFQRADAQIAKLGTERYDLAFSRFGVMFFDEPVAAFRNIYGALKQGGRLVFVCWAELDLNTWVVEPLRAVGRHIPLPPSPRPGVPGPFGLADEKLIKKVLAGAGFCQIEIDLFCTPQILGSDVAQAVDFLMQLSPTGGAIRAADPDAGTLAAIANDVTALLQPFAEPDGVTMGGAAYMVTAIKT